MFLVQTFISRTMGSTTGAEVTRGKQATQTAGKWRLLELKCFKTMLNGRKENCTFSKTHINEVIRFLANTARYSPPTFFTMESTKYKTGSFSADGAWSNRELNKFRKQQGLKTNISDTMLQVQCDRINSGEAALPPRHPEWKSQKQSVQSEGGGECVDTSDRKRKKFKI